MLSAKARFVGSGAAFAVLIGLALSVATPSRAQSGVVATVGVKGNYFECVAKGTNVPIAGGAWTWTAQIGGNGFQGTWGPSPTWASSPPVLSTLWVDVFEPPTFPLHGYCTCTFTGLDARFNVLWTAYGSYTFP